ncbi:MAG: hypothetical protein K2O29_11660 [Ruminococcus sp.]|nr:hypothetical protein [Ruminococcus sp.]MDE7139083.1 hypothetical protein [Ruminococcus sp.]
MKNKFDFNNQEDFRRAERLTYDGTLDYSDFPPPEYRYFAELRKVYHAFKFEGLSQENAERQKKSLLIDYRKYLENFTNAVQTYKSYQNNIKVSEMLKTDIQKSHDIHDIAVTAVQAIGLMTHDESFIKTNTAKLEALK